MEQLTNRRVDDFGRIVFDTKALFEFLYADASDLNNVYVEENKDIKKFNDLCKLFDMDEKKLQILKPPGINPSEFHKERQKTWFLPEEYQNLDLKECLRTKC